MEIKDRIKMIIDHEQMTALAFAESIGVAQATISHTLGDRNKYPSTDFLMKLHDRYPHINMNWLLCGQGNMLSDGVNADATTVNPYSTEKKEADDYPLFHTSAPSETKRDSVLKNTANEPTVPENRKDLPLEMPQFMPKEIVKQEIIYKEKPARNITEIRIFFDDNTYEVFSPVRKE